MVMRVAFRVDASSRIGTGHVVRCLTLADVLREQGTECLFIHRAHVGNMAATIRARGYAVKELAAPTLEADLGDERDYARWLGVPVEEDARETRQVLGDECPDWLVVDHYALDAAWEREFRTIAGRIAVLDDLADRPHDCDLLLDQNYFQEPGARYSGLVPPSTTCLCGPRYALLRPEYARARGLIGPRRGPVGRVLVFYGGADPDNETARALRVLARPGFAHLAVDVVIGSSNPHREALRRQAEERTMTTVHGPREHLVDLQIEADLALGGGGTTTWERCALGLPAIITAVAENQEPFNKALAEDGAIRYLGPRRTLEDDALAAALEAVVADPETLAAQAARAWHVTDGMGAWRMAEAMRPTSREKLFLRPAERSDKYLYSEWANDPRTLHDAHNPDSIPSSDHSHWFDQRLADPAARLWVLCTPAGLPVGQVRIELEDGETVLDYSIDPAFRGRGLGTRALELAVDAWRPMDEEAGFTSELVAGNDVCRRAFLRSGIRSGIENGSREALSLTILSDPGSWINDWVPGLLAEWLHQGHRVRWVHTPSKLVPGDLCFLLGCGQLLRPEELRMHDHNLVVHESDLPKGRGWSPLTWQILEGARRIPLTLLEAVESVDAGHIYAQEWIELAGDELLDELREQVGHATRSMCTGFVNEYPDILEKACPQAGEPSYYARRGPADSELDPKASLIKQFELLRVVDNERYPAFFEHRGHRYRLRIERADHE